jgi:hypothetical protein
MAQFISGGRVASMGGSISGGGKSSGTKKMARGFQFYVQFKGKRCIKKDGLDKTQNILSTAQFGSHGREVM